MNIYKETFTQFIIGLFVSLRITYWKHFRSKINNTISVNLTKEEKIEIFTYGDIAYTLYTKQPLIWFGDGFEFKTIAQIKKNVKKGDIVFDIGANIGLYSILLSKLVGNTGTVYAFEPNPLTVKYLKKNLTLNNCHNVIVSQIALSDENGKIILKKTVGGGDAFNYIVKSQDADEEKEIIDAVRLDDFIITNKIDRLDFVKMDIEGAELLCINGAKEKMLKILKPIIVTEVFEPWCERFNYTSIELLSLIANLNYKITNYDDHQWLCVPNNPDTE